MVVGSTCLPIVYIMLIEVGGLIQIFGVFLEVKISILICKKENNLRAP